MKTTQKLLATVMATLLVWATSATAFAIDSGFGSAGVDANKDYTLTEMLNYAIQDEYLAQAEYNSIIDSFGTKPPFTNVIQAEQNHISALKTLFAQYGAALPKDTADEYVVVPASLLDAYKAGVEAEVANIAMYETFLKQELPDDISQVFTALRNASEHHLAAFQKGVERLEGGTAHVAGNQRDQTRNRSW